MNLKAIVKTTTLSSVIDSYSEATKQIWYFPTSVGPVKK
jgi:hypothetical protein